MLANLVVSISLFLFRGLLGMEIVSVGGPPATRLVLTGIRLTARGRPMVPPAMETHGTCLALMDIGFSLSTKISVGTTIDFVWLRQGRGHAPTAFTSSFLRMPD